MNFRANTGSSFLESFSQCFATWVGGVHFGSNTGKHVWRVIYVLVSCQAVIWLCRRLLVSAPSVVPLTFRVPLSGGCASWPVPSAVAMSSRCHGLPCEQALSGAGQGKIAHNPV